MKPSAGDAARWRLTDQERERLTAVGGYKPVELVTMVVRSPRVLGELLTAIKRGAVEGAATNGSLVWVLDSRRAQRLVPGKAGGVNWGNEEWFSSTLLPKLDERMCVLDLGCGTGRISRLVAPRVRHLTCADVSRVLIGEARVNLAGLDNVDFLRTDGYTLSPLRDGRFDAVYAQGVFSHLDPTAAVGLLDEARRVTRPGGLSIINFFTIDHPAGAEDALRAARLAGQRRRVSGSAPKPYANAQVRAMHALVGLDLVEMVETSASGRESTIFVAAASERSA